MNPGNRPAASRRVVVAVLVIAAGAAAAWWYHSRSTLSPASVQAPSQPVMELAPAEVATATRKALVRRLPVSGTVTSMLKTTVRSRVSGEVLEVMFREGERVAAGAALARIDTRSLEAQVASARAARDKASADLEISRLNYENSKRLFQKKVLDQLGKVMVINGKASVLHKRASDPHANLERERPGIPLNEDLWARLVSPRYESDPHSFFFVRDKPYADHFRKCREQWLNLFS